LNVCPGGQPGRPACAMPGVKYLALLPGCLVVRVAAAWLGRQAGSALLVSGGWMLVMVLPHFATVGHPSRPWAVCAVTECVYLD
jgi:hypothetical protein